MNAASYHLERAVLADGVHDDVLVTVADGRFTAVEAGGRLDGPTDADDVVRLPGLAIPGLANCHSHAFHRALRGRTQQGRSGGAGTFWTWREQMYDAARRLDPDTYYRLALATYREMLCAGITSVGEFHYLHHQPDGTPYDDPNAMGHALVAAALDAGIRIALLDTCYLAAGFGQPPEGVQARFSDGDAGRWAERRTSLADAYRDRPDVVVGAAVHSVRAVPAEQLPTIVEAAAGVPLHVHVSEQPAENDACIAAYGATPVQLLADHGVLGPLTTAVHATHLDEDDIGHLGSTRTHTCFCPTTERDLGDGIGPSVALREAGAPLTLGSDSHAVIDLFEEMRAVELDERLGSLARGHWRAADLLTAAAATGQASLGFADAGAIAVGQRADLVCVDPTSARTAGTGAGVETAVYAAVAEDVLTVLVDGVLHDTRAMRADAGRALDAAIGGIWA